MGETRSGGAGTVHARSTDGRICPASKCRDRIAFGIREENGQCLFAMELVEGETLEMRVRRTGPLEASNRRHGLPGHGRAGRIGRRPGPPGFEAGESDVRRRRAECERFESRQTRKSRHRRKGDRFGVAKALVEKPTRWA